MTITFKEAVVICLVAALFSSAVAPGQQARSRNAPGQSRPTSLTAQSPLAPDRLFALASPAVVKLTIKDEDDREIGIASGFIVEFEKEKYEVRGQPVYRSTMITNYHVIRPAISVDVLFSDGRTGRASQVMGEDESADLAVLSVSSLEEPKRALKLHEGASPRIGTKVYAIGSPKGLSNTLSEGLISGYRERGKHEAWVQITAPISPGSSGGPLFSTEGLVLGVTTAFLSESQNLNFAVPASEVSRLLARPEKPRPIWEGASIRETEKDAFQDAEVPIFVQLLEADSKESRGGQPEQTYEGILEERASAGDQLGLLLKGRELYLAKEYDKAIRMLKRATEASAGEYAYLTHYAQAQAILKVSERVIDFEDAVQPLRRAKELNPDFGPSFYRLSCVYRTLHLYPEMLVAAESLVRLMPRCYDGYQLRGEAWAELGREAAFERDFETACGLRPNDNYLLMAKAGGYVSLDKLQEAVDTYKDVVKLDENYFIAHYNLGNALQKMGKYDEAIKSYQRTLKAAGRDFFDIEGRITECRREMQSP